MFNGGLYFSFQVFYFMQPETTAFKLAEDLLKAICEKFINNKTEVDEEVVEEDANEDDEPLIEGKVLLLRFIQFDC